MPYFELLQRASANDFHAKEEEEKYDKKLKTGNDKKEKDIKKNQ